VQQGWLVAEINNNKGSSGGGSVILLFYDAGWSMISIPM
jgi:hypothetical protein